jgi:tetratricopeptide (TPR) repeat protein
LIARLEGIAMKHYALAAVALALSLSFTPAPLGAQATSASAPSDAPQSAPQPSHPMTAFQADMIQGQAMMGAKDYDGAVRLFTTLTHERPKSAPAWNMLGVALQQTGQIESARAAYTRATKLNSKFAEAYNNIGTTWYQQQKYPRAIHAYQRAISADPNLASAYSNMGCAYFNEKKYPQALDAFNQAITLDPDVFSLSSHAGTILQDRTVSDHGAFYFLLAKSYAERNDAATCAEYLRKAFDEGYKSVPTVTTDPSFAKVLDYPGVQAVLSEAIAANTPPTEPAKTAPTPGS